MPKDEFDFDDPMELNGVALLTDEDTTEAMTECFIEEFMLMGYNDKQLLALFRNPHYLGMNMVLQKRGEQFVRNKIAEIFARWGRPVRSPASTVDSSALPEKVGSHVLKGSHEGEGRRDACPTLTDPLGNSVPKINL